MHERAKIEEHVVEGMDRQASGFIGVFQCYDGRVHGVGHVAETWAARFDHFLGALEEVGGRRGKLITSTDKQVINSEAESQTA